MSAYIIRKLFEAKKLSNEVESTVIVSKRFNLVDRPVDILNRHKVDELFDLDNPRAENLDLIQLCNQLIHSYVFEIGFTGDRQIGGVFFGSDYARKTHCYYISIDQFLKTLTRVSVDQIMSSHRERDTKTGEMKSVSRSNMSGTTFCQQFDFPKLILE